MENTALKVFGRDRFDRYLQDAKGDVDVAIELARWNQEFVGLLHTQIGYVELATRNAIDVQLRKLSLAERGTEDWTEARCIPEKVYSLLGSIIEQARRRATRDANSRSYRSSHRTDDSVLHADVLSQLMWGAWVKLIGESESSQNTRIQQELWRDCLYSAFAYGPSGEPGRIKLSRKLFYLQRIRNSGAHFDNLFNTAQNINQIINACFSVLSSIDPDLTQGWINPGLLRGKARELREILPIS